MNERTNPEDGYSRPAVGLPVRRHLNVELVVVLIFVAVFWGLVVGMFRGWI